MAGRACGVTVSVLLAVGTVGGCGTVAERRDDVRDTAAVFEQAVKVRTTGCVPCSRRPPCRSWSSRPTARVRRR